MSEALTASSAGSLLLRHVRLGDKPRNMLDALALDSALPLPGGGSEAWACSLEEWRSPVLETWEVARIVGKGGVGGRGGTP